ncbi:hypothetical protein ACXYTJ_00005, partial [Gilvimarinus sp. F26214L]|uniref:hypothetical protein n=1 Tax=Gilvimarinus sp. DZF01 TaxID=3461371 RepID=UPI004045B68A
AEKKVGCPPGRGQRGRLTPASERRQPQHVLPEHSHRRLQENRDFFKSLLDQSGVPMVFVGLPKSLGLLETPRLDAEKRSKKRLTFLTGHEEDQLKDRTLAGFRMRPYPVDSDAWKKVLRAYRSAMDVPCINLSEEELAVRCWLASYGRLSNILGEAIEITEGEREIRLKDLAKAYSNSEPADERRGNPFLISSREVEKQLGQILEAKERA